jgi:hypothetical protein
VDQTVDQLTHLARHYLTFWVALVVAPALLMTVVPSTAAYMRRLIITVTKIWFFPVTWAIRSVRRWLAEK